MKFIQVLSVFFVMSLNAHTSTRLDPVVKAWPYCRDVVETYEWDSVTPLGFSGQNLFAIAGESRSVKFVYGYKEGESVGTLTFNQRSPEVRYVRSEPVYPSEGGPDIGIVCQNSRVEIDVNIGVFAEDGAFNDTFETTLSSGVLDWCFEGDCPHAGSYADISFWINLDTLNGNFHKDVPAPVNQMRWWGRFTADGISANISYTNCECDEKGCASFQVNGASIEPNNP